MKYLLMSLVLFLSMLSKVWACDACKKQQPEVLQGITHGAGPQSNWDLLIVAVMAIVVLVTLIFSLKYLIKPGENNTNHIKRSILS